GGEPRQLIPGEGADGRISQAVAQRVQEEPLEPVPGDPQEEEPPCRQPEPASDQVEHAEEDGGADHVVGGDVVVDPVLDGGGDRKVGNRAVSAGQRLGGGALEDVVLGSEVVAGLDAVAPGGGGGPPQVLDDGEVADTPHHRPQRQPESR